MFFSHFSITSIQHSAKCQLFHYILYCRPERDKDLNQQLQVLSYFQKKKKFSFFHLGLKAFASDAKGMSMKKHITTIHGKGEHSHHHIHFTFKRNHPSHK